MSMDCWRGPVIDDEDALHELLDRAVAPPQVREEADLHVARGSV
jgi:hypothetical protein